MFTWQNRVAQAGASFFFPIFNYGRLVNQVRVQDARLPAGRPQLPEHGADRAAGGRGRAVRLRDVAGGARPASRRRPTAARAVHAALDPAVQGGRDDYTTVMTSEQSQLSIEDSRRVDEGQRGPRADRDLPRARRRLGDPRGTATSFPTRSRPRWRAARTGADCSRRRSTCRRSRRRRSREESARPGRPRRATLATALARAAPRSRRLPPAAPAAKPRAARR